MASYDQSSSLRGLIGALNRDIANATGLGTIVESHSRMNMISDVALVDGTVYYMGMALLAGDVVTNATIYVSTVGAGMTVSKLGLYGSDGTLLASTVDLGTTWQTAGLRTSAFQSPYTVQVSGWYYAAIIGKTGSSMPLLATGTGTSITPSALGTGKFPFGSLITQTDLPPSGAIAAGTTPRVFWIALS